ncbi:MAG: hypothetical protein OSB69_05680 [Alphaproteobacteria bacterium]|nr:hypothetical protein [Alphaproteobacteria bacterium]
MIRDIQNPRRDPVTQSEPPATGIPLSFQSGEMIQPWLIIMARQFQIFQWQFDKLEIVSKRLSSQPSDILHDEGARPKRPDHRHGRGEHVPFIQKGPMLSAGGKQLTGMTSGYQINLSCLGLKREITHISVCDWPLRDKRKV